MGRVMNILFQIKGFLRIRYHNIHSNTQSDYCVRSLKRFGFVVNDSIIILAKYAPARNIQLKFRGGQPAIHNYTEYKPIRLSGDI